MKQKIDLNTLLKTKLIFDSTLIYVKHENIH